MAAAASSAGNKTDGHPIPWLNTLATEPFYLLHLFAFFSYFLARSSATQSLSPEISHRLLRREIQALLTFSVFFAVKMVKEETWEAFIADTLLYAKGFLLAVTLVIDYHLAFCYLLGFVVIFLVAQQPPFENLGDCSQLTPLYLESLLTEGSTTRFWLVQFQSLSSSMCVRNSRIFPDLSVIYSNKIISFGIVDLGCFPNAAEKFGISSLRELPVYILFENGVEVARLPEFNNDFQASFSNISKKQLCQHFELDKRLIDYVSS